MQWYYKKWMNLKSSYRLNIYLIISHKFKIEMKKSQYNSFFWIKEKELGLPENGEIITVKSCLSTNK